MVGSEFGPVMTEHGGRDDKMATKESLLVVVLFASVLVIVTEAHFFRPWWWRGSSRNCQITGCSRCQFCSAFGRCIPLFFCPPLNCTQAGGNQSCTQCFYCDTTTAQCTAIGGCVLQLNPPGQG